MERPVWWYQGGRVSPTTLASELQWYSCRPTTLRAQSTYQVFAAAAFAIGPTNGGCGLEPCRKRIGCSAQHGQTCTKLLDWLRMEINPAAGRGLDLSQRPVARHRALLPDALASPPHRSECVPSVPRVWPAEAAVPPDQARPQRFCGQEGGSARPTPGRNGRRPCGGSHTVPVQRIVETHTTVYTHVFCI